jgi:hypothetical protein
LARDVNAENYHPGTNDAVETVADPLAFKALSYGLTGLLATAVLSLWVISLRREIIAGKSSNGLLPAVVVVAALCAFIGCLALTPNSTRQPQFCFNNSASIGDGWNQFSTMSGAGEHCCEIF